MKNSEFWVLVRKTMDTSVSAEDKHYPNRNLPHICILELTSDEMVYLWPYRPQFDSLCLVCSHLSEQSAKICKSNIPAGFPCQFQAVPEAEINQDFNDFLIDGEYIEECGYFYSFDDFIRQNNYTEDDFMFYKIGDFASIRTARQHFIQMHQSIIPFMK